MDNGAENFTNHTQAAFKHNRRKNVICSSICIMKKYRYKDNYEKIHLIKQIIHFCIKFSKEKKFNL